MGFVLYYADVCILDTLGGDGGLWARCCLDIGFRHTGACSLPSSHCSYCIIFSFLPRIITIELIDLSFDFCFIVSF